MISNSSIPQLFLLELLDSNHLCCLISKLCLTLCHSMDCSLPGSPVHGIFQARVLEWVATSYSRRSSQPRDQTCVSCISCIGRWVKRLSTMWETQVQSLGWEDPLEKEMAIHSSTIAWKIHGQRSLVGYSPWGCKESDTTE